MPIDWANVNWFYVAVLAIFVFVATLVGDLFSFSTAAWLPCCRRWCSR